MKIRKNLHKKEVGSKRISQKKRQNTRSEGYEMYEEV